MNNSEKVWLPIYEQVNRHFLEAHKKRDQVIAFYLLLLAALFGVWDKIKDFQNRALVGVWIVGILCFVVATLYRRWHITHLGCMVTLQRLMISNKKPSIPVCKSTWNAVNDANRTMWELMNPLKGVEAAIMCLLASMTYLPLHILLFDTCLVNYYWIVKNRTYVIILIALLYIFFLVWFSSMFVIKYQEFDKNEDVWVFRWLRNLETDINNSTTHKKG